MFLVRQRMLAQRINMLIKAFYLMLSTHKQRPFSSERLVYFRIINGIEYLRGTAQPKCFMRMKHDSSGWLTLCIRFYIRKISLRTLAMKINRCAVGTLMTALRCRGQCFYHLYMFLMLNKINKEHVFSHQLGNFANENKALIFLLLRLPPSE